MKAQKRLYRFYGCVPEITVPDNDLSAVTHADRYEPELNPTYRDLVAHYRTVIVPARVRKPQDKAKVENGVQQMKRWILGRLRNHVFRSVAEVNAANAEILSENNAMRYQGPEV